MQDIIIKCINSILLKYKLLFIKGKVSLKQIFEIHNVSKN